MLKPIFRNQNTRALFALNHKLNYLPCKSFSTNALQTQTLIPSNLQLADPKILSQPPVAKAVGKHDFWFPTLNVPNLIEVKSFANPKAAPMAQVALNSKIFSVAIRKDIVHQVVRLIRAAKRKPQKTKRACEVRGSTRKLRRQKGSGMARVGMARSNSRVGGGKAWGRVLRDYSFSLNRKSRAMALMIVLAAKQREGNLIVFDKLQLDTHKTKNFAALLEEHGLNRKLTLYVDNSFDENFERAARNLQYCTLSTQSKTNVYEILRQEKMVITPEALRDLQERIIAQKEHLGKRKSIQEGIQQFERIRQAAILGN